MNTINTASTVYTPSDLYAQLLQVVSGKRGCLSVKKKYIKQAGMEWKFVEQACEILSLKLVQHGRDGFLAIKK